MECGKCDQIKRNKETHRCGILKRQVSPFWGLIDKTLRCPIGKDADDIRIAEALKEVDNATVQ